MNHEELMKLITAGESETVELKASFDKEVVETAGAFANTRGRVILIGVSDSRKIVGIQTGKETLKDWANQISQCTDPRVIPDIETVEINGKLIVMIEIKDFPLKPVSLRGRYFRRVNNSNRVMLMPEIAQMHFESVADAHQRIQHRNPVVALFRTHSVLFNVTWRFAATKLPIVKG